MPHKKNKSIRYLPRPGRHTEQQKLGSTQGRSCYHTWWPDTCFSWLCSRTRSHTASSDTCCTALLEITDAPDGWQESSPVPLPVLFSSPAQHQNIYFKLHEPHGSYLFFFFLNVLHFPKVTLLLSAYPNGNTTILCWAWETTAKLLAKWLMRKIYFCLEASVLVVFLLSLTKADQSHTAPSRCCTP